MCNPKHWIKRPIKRFWAERISYAEILGRLIKILLVDFAGF